ncbi:MAG: nucleoside-diphosphate sugar epimerase/dehydratase [Patescibacteria group bacterium]
MFNSIAKRRIPFFAADAILIVSAVYLSFFLRFEGQIPPAHIPNIWGAILLALLFCLPAFYFFRLYSFSWAYVSTEELVSLAKAQALSFLLLSATIFILRDWEAFFGFPRSTLFISFVLIFFLCGGIRFLKRIYLQVFRAGLVGEKERTLIVGAGDAGEQILRNILNSKYSSYLPVGFVDDNLTKKGLLIHGVRVLGKVDDIPKIVKEEKIETLIVALPSAGSKIIEKAVERGKSAGLVKIKVLPLMDELINGEIKVDVGVLREIEMEDLLGRKPAVLDKKLVDDFIKNKKILITGAAGSIGAELCRQIAKFRPSLLLVLDQDETGIFEISEELKDKFPDLKIISLIADIADEGKIKQVFQRWLPKIIFHAAAYKHVPLMESQAEEAVKNNIFGTKVVAEASVSFSAEKFIFISTDKAVNPTSVMGSTKRAGEMLCQLLSNNTTKFISVRFGNVLNSRGSVVPIFKKQIDSGGPVKITHPEMKRYFMVASEACLLVMQAGAMGSGGEVFVLDMGDPIKIIDLAKELIKRSGFEPYQEIAIEYTKPRPGEKFFEELLTAEEGTLATQNQKIFAARLTPANKDKLMLSLNKLKEAVDVADKKYIIRILEEIVPSYKPETY